MKRTLYTLAVATTFLTSGCMTVENLGSNDPYKSPNFYRSEGEKNKNLLERGDDWASNTFKMPRGAPLYKKSLNKDD